MLFLNCLSFQTLTAVSFRYLLRAPHYSQRMARVLTLGSRNTLDSALSTHGSQSMRTSSLSASHTDQLECVMSSCSANTRSLSSYYHKPRGNQFEDYLELIRFYRPTGTYLLFLPCSWGLVWSAHANSVTLPDPYMTVLFALGAFIMRSAGCVINDIADRNIDHLVDRTRNRVICSGRVPTLDALIFLSFLLSCGSAILLQMSFATILLGTLFLPLVFVYPLAKRFTDWPQLCLGFTFNCGVLLAVANCSSSACVPQALPLYMAGVFWTLIYDTIYALQDKCDDMKIGVKSTALLFGDDVRRHLYMFALGSHTSLLLAGFCAHYSWPYFAGVLAASSFMSHQITSLRIDDVSDCGAKFKASIVYGCLVLFSLLLGNLSSKPITSVQSF